MENVSKFIADVLSEQGAISKSETDICTYGLEVFISSVLEIASIFVISAFAGNFLETVLFFAAFIPLRIYAGGYHASTKLRCYLLSLLVYGAFTFVMHALPNTAYAPLNMLFAAFSLSAVLIAAPIVHKNKNVSDTERKYYRKFSVCIALTQTLSIWILTALLPTSPFVISLTLGQLAVTLSMIAVALWRKIADNK